MSGVRIIGALLEDDAQVISKVPADRMKAGLLPDGIQLPALVVVEISSVERPALRRGLTVRTTDRVRVTVRAGNYRDRGLIIDLVKNCCAGRTGNIGGGTDVAIRHAGKGPDLVGAGSIFEKSIDFRVSYDATT